MSKAPDINAPILPGESLGGMRVGASIRDTLLQHPQIWGADWSQYVKLTGPAELSYSFDAIAIGVDAFSGRIYKLTAAPGYLGNFADVVTIGTIPQQLKARFPDLYFDEVHSLFLFHNTPGINFEVEIDDPTEQMAWRTPVKYISIIDPVLYSQMNQRGRRPLHAQ